MYSHIDGTLNIYDERLKVKGYRLRVNMPSARLKAAGQR